ncbi:MAG: hypothetical protein ACRDQD_04160 [Nocardioidaceae bacterium]
MAPREVEALRASLAAIVAAATSLARQMEDLHALAYDRQARDEVKVAGGSGGGVDTVGDGRARDLWRRLERDVPALEVGLVALDQAAGNLLSEGPSPAQTRGSLIAPGEFARAVGRQRERAERSEYVPYRTEDQPKYPGGKS